MNRKDLAELNIGRDRKKERGRQKERERDLIVNISTIYMQEVHPHTGAPGRNNYIFIFPQHKVGKLDEC